MLLYLMASSSLTAAQSRVAAPTALAQTVSDGEYDVVLLTRASAAGLAASGPMAEWFAACRKEHALPAGDSVTVVRSQPWDWNAPEVIDPDHLTILVSRSLRPALACGAPSTAAVVAYARGYRVSADTAYPYDAAITSATLSRRDSLVPPMDVERVAATRLTRRGLITVSAGLLRVSVPLDAVAPDSSGAAHDVVVEIVAPDVALPHRIAVPWALLRPLWEQAIEDRARAVSAELAASAAAAGPVLRARSGSSVERLEARVRLGDGFAQAGDVAMARVVLGQALQEEPCLSLAADMDERTRAVVSQVERPRGRCRAHLPLTLARAAFLPGLGQLDGSRRKLIGGVLFASVVGALALSQSTNASAKDLYARYRAVDGADALLAAERAASLYDQAESKRVTGQTLVMVGVGVWAATIVEAVLAEQRLARRLDRVQGYSTARRIGVVPVAGPSRVGLAITLF